MRKAIPPSTRIPILRAERGLRQYQLADAAKMDPSRLCRIESGRLKAGDKEVARIARALKVAPEALGL